MAAYRISISVVTYNEQAHIDRLLDALLVHTNREECRIFVVDNGSTDGTVDIVRGYDDVTLIENEKNLGFGAGHNMAITQIDSQYHICVNPDIGIDSDVIHAMAGYMDANPDIGVLTPKVLYPNGQLQVLPKRNPKLIYLIARRIGIKVLQKHREAYEMAEMNMDSAFDIEFATGCFMFMRTDILKRVGGFDERYFLYFEDADLTRSIRRYKRAVYDPQFAVYHHWDRAGARKLKFFLIQIHSMIKYMLKWRCEKADDEH